MAGDSRGLLMWQYRVFVVLICVHANYLLYGQLRQNTFQTLQINGATPYHPSHALTLDPFGFLWVGTIDGLLKYDGATLEAFKHSSHDSLSLPANMVFNLHSDNAGNIYVQCAGESLYMLYRKDRHFYKVRAQDDTAQPMRRVLTMITDQNNTTWLGTAGNLCACDVQDAHAGPQFRITCTWPDTHPLHVFNATSITAMEYQANTGIYVSTDAGIYRISVRSDVVDTIDGERQLLVRDIFKSSTGGIYVLTAGAQNLWKLNTTSDSLEGISGLTCANANSILYGCIDADQTIWVSELAHGIHSLDSAGTHRFYSPDQENTTILSDKYLRKPVMDYAGNIWWPGDPVYKLTADHQGVDTWNEPMRNMATVSAVLREDHILWLGTLGGGLVRYDLARNSQTRFDKNTDDPHQLPDERVYYIRAMNTDTLILLTRGHLVLFNKHNGTCKRYKISSGPIRSAITDHDGAWLTRSSNGIYYLNFHNGELQPFLQGGDQAVVEQTYYLHQDDRKMLWLCTLGGGLVRFDPMTGEIKRFTKNAEDPHSISSNILHMLAVDHSGLWWIGTSEGLNIFDPETEQFDVISTSDGLAGDLVQNVAVDPAGMIWVTAGSGMHMIDPATRKITAYGRGDGLTNTQYYPRSIYIDQEGKIYIGGEHGLNVFRPALIRHNTIEPKIWISGIERTASHNYDRAIELLDQITLSPSEDYVNISFASTHFASPETNRFEYRLLGFNDHWVDIGNDHTLRLAGMQPGTYTLDVRTFTQDGAVSTKPARLDITVLPPFYRTWWFYVALFLGIGAIVFALVRYRILQLKKEAAYQRRLAMTEMQALRSQMNPHFIFNSLNSIKSYIAGNEPRTASNYLTKFAQLMRHILNNSKEEQISLEDELKALELYIQLEYIRFDDKFSYKIDVDPGVPVSKIAVQPLIIQPFVENAIWHGLMHRNGAGMLMIRVHENVASILVEIEDNGIGRAQAGLLHSKTAEKAKSYGLQITQDRLRTKYQERSHIEIIDLYDQEHSPSGTLVKLQLPKLYLS